MGLKRSASGQRPNPQPAARIARGGRDFNRAMAALFCGGFSTFSLLYCAQPALPTFAREFNLTPAASSLALSATTGVLAFALLFAGTASDVIGRKRVMVISLAASSAIMLLAALARDWGQLLALRALTGLALSGLPAVAMAYLAEEMATSAVGLAMGLYIAGNTVRTLGGVFYAQGGWNGVAGLVGLLTVAGLVVALMLARVPPPKWMTQR
ncbi:MAG TPA: MFS transporter [Roseiarcus sp.]|nr:MFS transporter [Roseiarcus sp.]